MRSWLLLPPLLLCTPGCVDDEALENKLCASEDDCAPSQECLTTDEQQSLPGAYGWCRPKGEGCAIGAQPGCECEFVGEWKCTTVNNAQPVTEQITPDQQSCECVTLPPETTGTT